MEEHPNVRIARTNVTTLINEFNALPILYKARTEVFEKLKTDVQKHLIGQLDNTLLNHCLVAVESYQIQGTPEFGDHAAALDDFARRLKTDPLYARFETEDFSRELYDTILNKYKEEAPENLIQDIIGYRKVVQRTSESPRTVLSDDDLITIAGSVKVLLKYIADNPRNHTTITAVSEMIKLKFANYPQFQQLLRYMLVMPLEDGRNSPFSEPLTRFLSELITKFVSPENRKGAYQFLYSKSLMLLSNEMPQLVPVFISIFGTVQEAQEKLEDDPKYKPVIDLCGALLAMLIDNNVSQATAYNTCAHVAHELLKSFDDDDTIRSWDDPFRLWLWSVYEVMQPKAQSALESIGTFLSYSQRRIEGFGIPEGIIGSVVNAFSIMGLSVYGVLDKILEVIVQAITTMTGHMSSALLEYTYLGRGFLSAVLPEARRRPKAVWALLFANDFRRLTPAQKFAISCNLMEEEAAHEDYSSWAQKTADLINSTHLASVPLEVRVPLRTTNLPSNPMVSSKDLADVVPLMPETVREATLVQDSIRTWIASGVHQGIDASWFASPERIHHSVSRYAVERPEYDMEDYYLIKEVAHAMANQAPHLYKDALYITPEAASAKIKKKYSPGLPYIPTYRSRAQIRDHGFFRAMTQVASTILQEGIARNPAAHVFEKMNVVQLDKLLATGINQKAIVTVVAEDLLSSIVALCALGDLGKRVPKVGDWVMNTVKRSEAGFKPFYEELEKRKSIIQADARQFDSSLGALIGVEGLSELRAAGYAGQAIEDIATSQIRSRYIGLKNSLLVTLVDGLQHPHTGGLMTGQALTATDNRDAFRLLIIFGWSKATGKHPSLFWDTNTLGNAGDDNAWGSDDGEEIMFEALAIVEKATGVKVLLEAQGFENIDLTGLQIIPVPEHSKALYIKMGLDVPRYSVRTTPEKLLLKKTEFKVTLSRLRDFQFYCAHINVLIGTALTTAHNLPIYSHFAHDYMREMEYVLLRFFRKVEWEVTYSDDGYITSVHANPLLPRARTSATTVRQFQIWLKAHRMLSYEKIFSIWMEPNDMEKSKMVKAHAKFLALNPQVSSLDKANWGLIMAREAFYKYIPNHVARAMPEFEGLDLSVPMRNQNFIIAKFVWLSYYQKTKKIPTGSFLMTLLRENPYASAEDPVSFMSWLATGDNLQLLAKSDLETYRGNLLAITVVYWYIETIAKALSFVPGLGIFWSLFALSTRDVNRLYSVLNYIHMMATGRSSPVISNMMPPDPYAWIKQLAVIITTILPPRAYGWIPGLRHVVGIMPSIVEWWAAKDATTHPNVARRVATLINVPHPWVSVLRDVARQTDNLNKGDIAVEAPTGTGKSTAFIKGLFLQIQFSHTIWLTQPTKTARDNYTNDFLAPEMVQILYKGVVNNHSQRLKVLTAGHYCTRLLGGEVSSQDLLIVDENHLCQASQLYAWFYSHHMPRMTLSATPPLAIFPRPVSFARYQGGKRFTVVEEKLDVTLETLITHLYKEDPVALSRALIVQPTKREVRRTIMALSRLSIEAYELSSDIPVCSPRGVIVATTIVDTAVTILPAPTMLIDTGYSLEINYIEDANYWPSYKAEIKPSTPSVHVQRKGRVGRKGDSKAYLLGPGGQGLEKGPQPNAREILFDTSVAPSLMNCYDLRLGVARVREITNNIFDFIALAPTIPGGTIQLNSIALGYLIVSELSGGVSLESARIRWEMARLGQVEDEDYSLVLASLLEMTNADPLLGSWHEAINMHEQGVYGFTLLTGTFLAAPALIVKKGFLVPSTMLSLTITKNLGGTTLSQRVEAAISPKQATYESFHANINLLPLTNRLVLVPMQGDIMQIEWPDKISRPMRYTPTVGSAFWQGLIGALLVLRMGLHAGQTKLLEIVFNEDYPLNPGVQILHVKSHHCHDIPNSKVLDVSRLPIGRQSYKLVWVLIISALLPDGYTVIYNTRHGVAINHVRNSSLGVFTVVDGPRMVIEENLLVKPCASRLFSMELLESSLCGRELLETLFSIPIKILKHNFVPIDPNLLHAYDSTLYVLQLDKFRPTSVTGNSVNTWKIVPL